MKRIFDFLLSIFLIMLLAIPMLLIALCVRITSSGSSLHFSDRVGKDNKIFRMPKFRSMLIETPEVASHLLDKPDDYLTPIGKLLRSSSLDELPQLFSVIKGEMSFVGPRPALFNQEDLIKLRVENGIHKLLPGITGWAQVNGRDNINIEDKVELDLEYMNNYSFWLDVRILWMTVLKVISRTGVSH